MSDLIPKNPDFKELIKEKFKGQHFMHLQNMSLTKVEAGKVTAEVILEQKHEQQDGFAHGGVTATLADVSMGFAAFSLCEKGKGMVTSKLDIAYLRPAIGGKLIANGSVVKAGRQLYYCEADIININDSGSRLVARGYGVMSTIDLEK